MNYDFLSTLAARAQSYLQALDERSVVPTAGAIQALHLLDESFPEHGESLESTIELMDRVGSPATMATAGGRYFGFVTGGSLPGALAANWLSAAWDNNSALQVQSPATAFLEGIAARWVLEALGLPELCGVGFVTGATSANTCGLLAARGALLRRQGWDVESQGLFGAPPIKVVVSEEVHVSVLKSLGIVGLGRDRIVRIPVDDQGRMRADQIPDLSELSLVCLQAGNVNTGAFDPAEEIIRAAQRERAWVHVDGAFGLWALASPGLAHLAKGFLEADSFATDGHKMLNVPYDSGFIICREREHLVRALTASADYLQSSPADMAPLTPEFSRKARGIEVWAALRTLGASGLADLVERNHRFAVRTGLALEQMGLEVPHEVVFNQVLARLSSDRLTQDFIENVQACGMIWAGGTSWQGRRALRISFSSWRTTEDDVDRALEAIRRIVVAGP